ncbi:hypothetical protein PspLS_05603 [Pyricularia sp. CBS 133598]|nr:hypothetical protein PspLS_05603 [Pyricularia sp. CBS 133598]
MGALKNIAYYAFHPVELRAIIQWKIWHEPVHTRDPSKERPTETSCFKYLDLTSRSFAAVIKELNPELLMPVCIFYLALRGLDTIEDDMTIPNDKKIPLLRNFADFMDQDGWTFNENGPNERDRDLLVHFDDVITELKLVKKPYYEIIRDITVKMGNGMADYVLKTENTTNCINTVEEYEMYCHYVAGLVGEGLTRLFVVAELANPKLLERMDLAESMGQFLQKTNIIRDVHEDYVDKRSWWPRSVWSKYAKEYDDLFKPENRQQAIYCCSELVLNALKNVEDCLYYMAGMREQSVFNFVAIPQTMAIATLELVFQNPKIFERNVKITKGDACRIMLRSTQNLRLVTDLFKEYTRKIHQKNDPRDPNYAAISAQCGKIEQFIETIFPSQDPKVLELAQKDIKMSEKPGMDTSEAVVLILAVLAMFVFLGGLMVGLAWLMGAHFNNFFSSLDAGVKPSPLPSGHQEL